MTKKIYLIIIPAVIIISGCKTAAPIATEPVDPPSVTNTVPSRGHNVPDEMPQAPVMQTSTYTNDILGYTMELPAEYKPHVGYNDLGIESEDTLWFGPENNNYWTSGFYIRPVDDRDKNIIKDQERFAKLIDVSTVRLGDRDARKSTLAYEIGYSAIYYHVKVKNRILEIQVTEGNATADYVIQRLIFAPDWTISDGYPSKSELRKINVSLQHENGIHTYNGILTVPTPCYVIESTVDVAESYPEQVMIRLTIVDKTAPDAACIQVTADKDFVVRFQASIEAKIRATLNGEEVEWNVVKDI